MDLVGLYKGGRLESMNYKATNRNECFVKLSIKNKKQFDLYKEKLSGLKREKLGDDKSISGRALVYGSRSGICFETHIL